ASRLLVYPAVLVEVRVLDGDQRLQEDLRDVLLRQKGALLLAEAPDRRAVFRYHARLTWRRGPVEGLDVGEIQLEPAPQCDAAQGRRKQQSRNDERAAF